jgi:predicted GNAT family N-acyltransferase
MDLINGITISEIRDDQIPAAHALIMREFDSFIGVGYSKRGRERFRELITLEYVKSLPQRNGFSVVALDHDDPVGVFSVRDVNFITLFFVDRNYQSKGIGKRLFTFAKNKIAGKYPDLEKLTVHSSPYAEKIYYALGFTKSGDETEEDGIKFIPMEFRLR